MNCPLVANADQQDFDGDGLGDVCDGDVDGDGVIDGNDLCLDTPPGAIVNSTGCAIEQFAPCGNQWRNHGAYVKAVAHAAEAFLELGLITEEEKDGIVSAAAQSSCGSKE